jgi:sulfate adenylyltransferase
VDLYERKEAIEYARSLKKFVVNARIASDLELIATGAYSPLEGFLRREDYIGVIRDMHLANGLPWTIPITLPVDKHEACSLTLGEDIALVNDQGEQLALFHIEDLYTYDKALEADLVFKTRDLAHPGVKNLREQGDILLGGKITYLADSRLRDLFARHYRTPEETRHSFAQRGWRSIVAFQTRNPIHRAHEYIQKCALEIVDGLLVHPLVGETKADDVPAEVRIRCYETLLENYYPPNRTLLSVFPASMRYAGPREAVFHALVRKNYGATHFIVGRDHAGVGNYYGPYDAQKIFTEFDKGKIGITPLFFESTFYCKPCGQMASDKTCNHENGARVYLSGSKIRELLRAGQMLPEEFTRPEISKILIEAYRHNEN